MHDLFGRVSSLLAKFYMALDGHDFATVAECFASDGVWVRQGKTLNGGSEIQKTLSETKPLTSLSVHIFNNLCIDSQSEHAATCRYYLTVYRHSSDLPRPYPVPKPGIVGSGRAEFVYDGHAWLLKRMQTGPHLFAN